LYGFYSSQKDLLDTIDWNTWLFKSGLPPKPQFDTTLVDQCYSLADKWISAISEGGNITDKFSAADIAGFSANQNSAFLDKLVSYEGVNGFSWKSENGKKAIEAMGKMYSKYETSQNAEVIFRWFRLLLTANIEESYQRLADWLGLVGRMKFVRPSYTMLNKVDRDLALKTFEKFEMIYHPICRAMVKKDLGL